GVPGRGRGRWLIIGRRSSDGQAAEKSGGPRRAFRNGRQGNLPLPPRSGSQYHFAEEFLMKAKLKTSRPAARKAAARRKTLRQINADWSADWSRVIKKAKSNTRKLSGRDALAGRVIPIAPDIS